nr:UDP-N-acetylmuramoyl-L-alanine--D-glutamate ligase [Piscinibacter sakaiensis]
MARWCRRLGARVRVWDSRGAAAPQAEALRAACPEVELLEGPLDAQALLAEVRWVLKSPGLSPRDARIAPLLEQARAIGVPVQGELALFAQALARLRAGCGYAPRVVAVTGTNGKTTTTAMAALLIARCGRRVAVAGNIGPTLLQTLSDVLADEDLALLQAPAAGSPAPEPGADAASLAAPEAPAETIAPDAADPARDGAPDDAAEEGAPHAAAGTVADAVAEPAPDPAADATAPADDAHASHEADAAPALSPDAAAALAALQAAPAADAPPPRWAAWPEAWVLELSSFQLDGVEGFAPDAAAVLNLSEDHLDWHGSMAAYAAAKGRIYGPPEATGVAVVNRDDPQVTALLPAAPPPPARSRGAAARRPLPRRVVSFGLGAPQRPGDYGLVSEHGMAWLVRAQDADETLPRGRRAAAEPPEELHLQRLMPADALRVRGRHNAANALAALALAAAIGCPLAPMLHGLREYAGEPHRVEYVASVGAVDAYDDSKGTNVGATVAAIDGLGADREPSRLVLILGGDGKGQDFAPLAAPLQRHARAVATLGRDAAAIEQAVGPALQAAGLPLARHDSLEAATRWAFAQAQPGDSVLLSPACASLDMFRNYAHRAAVFVEAVQQLAAEAGEVVA